MSFAEKAVAQMESWAADPTHGYDQSARWGPDYDCSSAVISAWELAGVPVKSRGASYTGNMRGVFMRCGFEDVTASVQLGSGAGLQRGDVLLNYVNHTAMYCGDGYTVEASINEYGTITGGRTGDQSGREFLKRAYRNYPWDCVLRYTGNADTAKESAEKLCSTKLPELCRGNVGEAVKSMQILLESRGYSLGIWSADGQFGWATLSALLKFQQDLGLEKDGICGKNSWQRLIKG